MTDKAKWYYGIVPVFVALLLMGPFAFPLLWKSQQFNLVWKILLTVLVTVATIWMIKASVGVTEVLIKQINLLKQAEGM